MLGVVSGSGQSATVGSALPSGLTVRVATAAGVPVGGATVTFAVTSGNASVSPASVVSDVDGLATTQLTLGMTAGTALFRDWATSLLTDDLTGVAARYQQPSWSFRSLFGTLGGSGYPLGTQTLVADAPRAVRLVGGGAAFLRFAVAAGGSGAVQWGTLPSTVQLTLVRTR